MTNASVDKGSFPRPFWQTVTPPLKEAATLCNAVGNRVPHGRCRRNRVVTLPLTDGGRGLTMARPPRGYDIFLSYASSTSRRPVRWSVACSGSPSRRIDSRPAVVSRPFRAPAATGSGLRYVRVWTLRAGWCRWPRPGARSLTGSTRGAVVARDPTVDDTVTNIVVVRTAGTADDLRLRCAALSRRSSCGRSCRARPLVPRHTLLVPPPAPLRRRGRLRLRPLRRDHVTICATASEHRRRRAWVARDELDGDHLGSAATAG